MGQDNETDCGGDESSAEESCAGPTADDSTPTSPIRRSVAALEAARQIFGFEDGARPTVVEIEEAFRQQVRSVHPDRAGDDVAPPPEESEDAESRSALRRRTRGWAMSRVTWARKVLREASTTGWWEGTLQEQAVDNGGEQQIFMLGA